MSLEDNKAVVRSFLEKANREKRTPVEMCAAGVTFHIGASPVMDLQGFRDFQTAYYAAFSDPMIIIADMVAEGDRVAFRGVVHATHTGTFMATVASGNQIIVPVIGMARVTGGKIAEWWNSPDRLSWMQQIGALPAPGPAGK
jgi:predicted ester cyclase